MPTTLTLESLYTPIQAELDEVRAKMMELWAEALELVHGKDISPPRMGGKMLRPAMTLLATGALNRGRVRESVPLATGMELLHLAALIHDDVVDSSDTRRGQRSLKAQWDNHTAVLGGDYLMARSINMMSIYDSCAVIVAAVNSVCQMAAGELTNFGLSQEGYSRDDCIALAKQKTASLFAVSCATPTLLHGGAHQESMERYGMSLGIAFQLVDDILDLCQSGEALGKPACGDVAEGKKTLPLLILRENLDGDGRQRLDALTGAGGELEAADREWIGAMVERTGAREQTETVAREYAETARQALTALPSSPYRDSMAGLVDFVLSRGS